MANESKDKAHKRRAILFGAAFDDLETRSLGEIVEMIDAACAKLYPDGVPLDALKIEIDEKEEEAYFFVERDETTEERRMRERREAYQRALAEQDERAQLARLKAKYEGAP
jgi:hypothetical protein